MILSRKYLKRLISNGSAGYTMNTAYDSQVHDNSRIYIAVDRYDKQRVDHYIADEPDLVGPARYA